MPKIFEKLICKQLTVFADQNLSTYQCGLRKGLSAQYSLVAMLEGWKGAVDDKKVFGALLTFDCLSHGLIIAKLNVYGFSLPALKLIHDFLSSRQQRTKINRDFSSWEEILFGVPLRSALGPILFNIFLSDLFLVMKETEFTSYADDNTGNTIEDVISSLQESSEKLFRWFSDNQMQGNSGKCHLILGANEPAQIQIGESLIKSTNYEKLLGVKIDFKLSFDKHIKTICKKASNTLRILAIVTPDIAIEKKKAL